MPETLKDIQEDLSKLLKQYQDKLPEIEKAGQQTDEGLKAMQLKFGELSEELQKQADAIRAKDEEMKQLEALLARRPEAPKPGEKTGDPELRKQWKGYLAVGDKRTVIPDEVIDKGITELAEHYEIPTDQKSIAILKAGLVGSNPDLGFLAPIDPVRFISRRIFETSPVRQLANVISTAREAVEIVIDDMEPASGWVAELDSRPDTGTPQIATIEIPTHEQYAEPKISTKALDDVSINVESWLQEKIARKFARTENTAFILGTGVKQPRGINDYADWTNQEVYERGKLATNQTTAVGTLAGDDLIDTQAMLIEDYQAGAAWMMHRLIWAEVMQLKDQQNQYLLSPMLLFAGVDMQLLGKPVRFAGDLPSAIAENALPILYGDFREGYTVVDRIGIRVLRDPYTDKRFVKFYTTKRVGGAVTNYQAIKRLRIQAS